MRAAIADFAIQLTDKESVLASRIDFNPEKQNYESWKPIADAMAELMASLLERGAIPLARRKFFTEPFIGGHGRSHMQVFEGNGTRGDDIFRHPNFVKYLRYFLHGADLPKTVIEAFQRKVIGCGEPFTGSDALEVADFARQITRSHGLDTHTAPEEFYKLALDCGLDPGDARSVRDTVMKMR
jgi:hypothetical protein